jgi:amino acid adenylation domain-containing protein
MWFLQQLDPENNAYNTTNLVKITGGVDRNYLERALNYLIARHEPLRTLYPNQGGRPVMVVQPFKPIELPFVDFSDLPEEERTQAIQKYFADHSNQIYDLQLGPSIRTALIHVSDVEDIFFFGTHHIGSDAWSRQVFINDLAKAYESIRAGKEPDLPVLPIQYTDYALWQRDWLSGETLEAFTSHWKNVLSGNLPTLELPTDRTRPILQTFRGERYQFIFPPHISSAVKSFCQRERITPFHLYLATYALLLNRYSGQEDIIIGCPFANRPTAELDNLVGLFVNTLPIRVNLSGNPTVRAQVERIKNVMLDAFTWQAAPFEAVVSEISPERDLSRTPVFQVTINMRNTLKQFRNSFEDFKMEALMRDNPPAPFDLSLEFDEIDGNFIASFLYNADLFEEKTIIRMAAHYQNLLGEMLQKPDRPISEMQMLAPSEKSRLLSESGDLNKEYAPEQCLHELVEEQAAKTPNAKAVRFEGQELSFQELNRRANQLAHTLRGLGVGPDTLVAVFIDRSPEMIVSLLAILKAGGAYVPIDPDYPMERRNFIIQDSAAVIILTVRKMVNDLPSGNAQIICVDLDESIFTSQSDENLPNLTKPENLAYIIYTSGSTGMPNGVMVTHYNVVRLFQATDSLYQFSANDVWTMFHSYAFDFSVWEIWGALTHGGLLVIVPFLVSRSPELFYQLVKKENVTVLNQTPSAFFQFIHAEEILSAERKLNLRLVIFGGEVLDFSILKRWLERHGDTNPKLFNMYGITETTVHVTAYRITLDDITAKKGSMIGKPIGDLQVYLLDEQQNLCPSGVRGEMYVGGSGLARGYLNRNTLTSERFITNPFQPGKRLYKSGDLAKRYANGDLEYLGRADFQVKIRGFRVELGEIESTLEKHSDVLKSVTLLREDISGDKRLVSYIVPKSGATLNQGKLREFLVERLPIYMVPSAFVFLDSIPLTINGKVDLRALPLPEYGKGRENYLAPRNDTEKRLVAIWGKVLGVKKIGVRDNFFELGGHSLLAVRLFTLIQEEFGQSLPLLLLFKESTVEALANFLIDIKKTATLNGVVPIRTDGQKAPLFILPAGLYMGNLANALVADHPIYALYPYENGKLVYRFSVQETAKIYYDCLTKFFPDGPYLLLGHSADGYFALELARLLKDRGKVVRFLGLLDTYPPKSNRLVRQPERIQPHLNNLKNKNWVERLNYLVQALKREMTRWYKRAKDLQEVILHQIKGQTIKGRNTVLRSYKPDPYDGKVYLFSVSSRPEHVRGDPMARWSKIITGELKIIPVQGFHMSILEPPQVSQLAEKILVTLSENETDRT